MLSKPTFNPTAAMSPVEYNKTLLQCWKILQAGRRVAIHRSLIQITGNNIKTAAFLSQLMYWLRVGTKIEQNGGWIFKSVKEMEMETGLTVEEQRKCKNELKKLNFVEIGFFGQGRNLAFKLNIDAICQAVCRQFNVDNVSQITLEDWRKQELDFFRVYFSDSVVYHMSLVHMTGDIYIAIMLSDILFNCAKNGSETSKLFKRQRLFSTATMREWEQRTYITRTTQTRARDFMKYHGLILETHYLRNARIFSHPDGLLLMKLLRERTRLSKPAPKKKNAANLDMQQQSLLPQSEEDLDCGNNVEAENLDVGNPANPDLANVKSCNLDVGNPANPDLANVKSCNLDAGSPATPDLANVKSCNLDTGNPATPDLANVKSCNLDTGNPATPDLANVKSCNSSIYKNPTGFSITTTTNSDSEKMDDVVVVGVKENLCSTPEFTAAGRFEKLIFPKSVHPDDRPAVLKAFNRLIPNGEVELLQLILDETAAGGSNIKNPVSYIVGIIKKASNGEFDPVKALQFQRIRNGKKINEQQHTAAVTRFDEHKVSAETAEKEREKLREHLRKMGNK